MSSRSVRRSGVRTSSECRPNSAGGAGAGRAPGRSQSGVRRSAQLERASPAERFVGRVRRRLSPPGLATRRPPVARASGCSQDVWLTLAEGLDDAQPREALAIYREQVEPTINRKTKADHRDASELLAKVRELMARVGQADEFPGYLEEVRAAHRRKRNLMKLLDGLEDG